MCWHCLGRRGFLAGAVLAPLAAARAADFVEPATRLTVAADAPRTVALTLDACSGAVDMRIVDAVIRLSVPVTVFVTGLWLAGNAEALAVMRAHGDLFALQNHGARHLAPVLGGGSVYRVRFAGTMEAIAAEVSGGSDAVVAAGWAAPGWYRGAAGLYSPGVSAALEAMGWRVGGYSLNADAGASLPAASVARLMAGARSGDVIVAHVNQPRRASGAGVVAGIEALRGAGVRFVGLDEVGSVTVSEPRRGRG